MNNILLFNNIKLYDTIIIFDIFRSIKYNSLVCICNNKHDIKNKTGINIFDIKIKIDNIQYNPEFIKLNDYILYEAYDKNIRESMYDGFDIEICFIKDFSESINEVTVILGDFDIDINIEPLDTRFHNKKCISTIQKNETHLIDSWINYYTKLGFEYFFIYDNNFNIENYKELLVKYKDILFIYDMNYPYWASSCYGNRPIAQFVEMNHCLWKFSPEFLGLFDLDEYIYLKKDINIFGENVSVLSFPNYWFGCNNGTEYNYNNFIYKLNRRESNLDTYNSRKCIHKSKYVDLVCVHNALNIVGEYKRLTHDEGYLRHYRILSQRNRRCECNSYCQISDTI
jgi:hypothetical protein